MKHRGVASAHTIEEDPSQEALSEKSEPATGIVQILFRLRNEARTAPEISETHIQLVCCGAVAGSPPSPVIML